MTGTSQYSKDRKWISPVVNPRPKADRTGMSFSAYKSGKRANQISQSKPILGKAPVSKMPLKAASSMFFLWVIFPYDTS